MDLESLWKAHHPYEVPEFLVMDAAKSSKEYGKWVEKCCRLVVIFSLLTSGSLYSGRGLFALGCVTSEKE